MPTDRIVISLDWFIK